MARDPVGAAPAMRLPTRPTLAVTLALGAAAPALAGDLSVFITNVAPLAGASQLRAAIYDSEEAFEKNGAPVAALVLRNARDGAHLAVGPLPPGKYAVRVFQDLNDNGKVDTNLLGVPTEPFGFSNDAIGTLGPPSFGAAAVVVGDAGASLKINLRR